jgi:predicted nucleic acid-binding protein
VTYVFDAEPLLAYLYNEPGHEIVASRLNAVAAGETDGLLAEVNASELSYLIARIEGVDDTATEASLRTADRDVWALSRRGLTVTRADWRTVAEIKAAGDVALGDAHAVALAADRNATLFVGADDDFDDLPVGVDVERFRDHGV